MHRSNMAERWHDIPLFLACMRGGSLTSGSKHVGLDVSTASRRLAALEAALGLPLFERTRSGLLPTDAARALLPAAEEAERGMAHLVAAAGAWEAAAEGVVRIATAPGIADTFLPPVLATLRTRHPGLAFEVEAAVRTVDLGRNEADLALRSIRPEEGDLVVRKLLTARWVVAGSQALSRSVGCVQQWNDVPWISWGADLGQFHASQWVLRNAPGATPALRTSHFGTQLAAARAGMGVLLVPVPYLAHHDLVPILYADALGPSAAEWPQDPLYLVAHRAMRHDPRVAVVWDALVEHLRGEV